MYLLIYWNKFNTFNEKVFEKFTEIYFFLLYIFFSTAFIVWGKKYKSPALQIWWFENQKCKKNEWGEGWIPTVQS